MPVDIETIVISGVVGIVTSAITAYFTSKLKISEEREKWYRDLANKYAEAITTNPAVAESISKQFAIALIIMEGTGHMAEMDRQKFFILPHSRLVVGRDTSCEISVDNPHFSKKTAAFSADGSNIFIESFASRNVPQLNGKMVEGRTRIKNGDEILIGEMRFELIELV